MTSTVTGITSRCCESLCIFNSRDGSESLQTKPCAAIFSNTLGKNEAQKIGWAAFLEAIGEPYVPALDIGIIGSFYRDTVDAQESVPYEFKFEDLRSLIPNPSFKGLIGRVWVDKVTGSCRVWVNEDFEPPPADQVPYGGTYGKRLREQAESD